MREVHEYVVHPPPARRRTVWARLRVVLMAARVLWTADKQGWRWALTLFNEEPQEREEGNGAGRS